MSLTDGVPILCVKVKIVGQFAGAGSDGGVIFRRSAAKGAFDFFRGSVEFRSRMSKSRAVSRTDLPFLHAVSGNFCIIGLNDSQHYETFEQVRLKGIDFLATGLRIEFKGYACVVRWLVVMLGIGLPFGRMILMLKPTGCSLSLF